MGFTSPRFITMAAAFLLAIYTISFASQQISPVGQSASGMRLFDFVQRKVDKNDFTKITYERKLLNFSSPNVTVSDVTSVSFVKSHIVGARTFYVLAILASVVAIAALFQEYCVGGGSGGGGATPGANKVVIGSFITWWLLLWVSQLMLNMTTSGSGSTNSTVVCRYDLVALGLFLFAQAGRKWSMWVGVLALTIALVEASCIAGQSYNADGATIFPHGLFSYTVDMPQHGSVNEEYAVKLFNFTSTNYSLWYPLGDGKLAAASFVLFEKNLILGARAFYIMAVISLPILIAVTAWEGAGPKLQATVFSVAFLLFWFSQLMASSASPPLAYYSNQLASLPSSIFEVLPFSLLYFVHGWHVKHHKFSTRMYSVMGVLLLLLYTVQLPTITFSTSATQSVRLLDMTRQIPQVKDTPEHFERINLRFGNDSIPVYNGPGVPEGHTVFWIESYIVGARTFYVFAVLAMVLNGVLALANGFKEEPITAVASHVLFSIWLFCAGIAHFLAAGSQATDLVDTWNRWDLWLSGAVLYCYFWAVGDDNGAADPLMSEGAEDEQVQSGSGSFNASQKEPFLATAPAYGGTAGESTV